MSEKRRQAMATIEAGLPSNTLYIDGNPVMGPDGKPLTSGEPETDVPSLAPDVVSNLTEPDDVPGKKGMSPKDYAAYIKRTHSQGLTLEQQQQRRQSLLKAQVQRTVQASGKAINGLQNGIGSLSMPGGIGLPLATLIIMLMLLIPVNGKTRFGWLWGVMTGNAALTWSSGTPLTGGVAGPGGTSSTSFSNGTGQGSGAPSMSPSMYMPSGMFLGTGVEGVQQ